MKSFWQEESAGTFPRLTGHHQVDVAIVGAGYTGSWLAYWLRDRGLQVLVVEAQAPGYGASGRNGGLLLQGPAQLVGEAAQHMGHDTALALVDWTRRSFQWVGHLARRYDLDYHTTGSLYVAGDAAERPLVQETARLLNQGGIPAELWEPAQQPPSIRRLGHDLALFLPDDGQIHPLKLIRALLAEATACGVRVYQHSPVRHYRETDGAGILEGEGYTVQAAHVVAATNAYTGQWLPEIGSRLRPVRGQMLASEPTAPLDHAYPVYADYGFNYWHQRPDGRILAGGFRHLAPDDEVGTDLVLHQRIQERLTQLVTTLAGHDVPISHRWAGIMALTEDKSPWVGSLTSHLWAAIGYNGHGSTVTPAAARMLADALLDGTPVLPPWAITRRGGARRS